ncbi:MAG: hypothetical protein EOP04_23620, partial [Proteobacteria bacterium]
MKAFVVTSMVVALSSGVAMAKGAGHKDKAAAPSVETLDADKDGKLSKDEVKADSALTGKFDTLDANKDGFLDQGELKAGHGAKPA